MNDLTYEIILSWDKRDCVYVAEVPELPGCMAHGISRTDAVNAAGRAISAWIHTANQDGLEAPVPGHRLARPSA